MDEEVRRRRRQEARARVHGESPGGGRCGGRRRAVARGWRMVLGAQEATTSPWPVRSRGRSSCRAAGARSCRTVAWWRSTGLRRTAQLGELGIGSPERAARRLERQARPYARRGRPVLPAFELIAAIVTNDAGNGGDHSIRQEPATIRRYLGAARAHHMLLLLDIQPGYAPFLQEAEALEQFLKEPDVSLALDPEWSMDPPQLPGQEIGSTDADTINEVSRYLSSIVRRYDLPQKLLVVHRFTGDMIEAEHDLERHPGVALVANVDGFGDQPNKISKYNEFTNDLQRRFNGFKLFYHEDMNLMKPKQVLRLRPQPDLVVYE